MSERAKYICAGCGSHEHLYGVAGANVSGRVLEDGSVEESYSDQWGTHEDSIECQLHLSAFPILELVDGVYCRFERCEGKNCVNGNIMVSGGGNFGRTRYMGTCKVCAGKGDQLVPVTAMELAVWRVGAVAP